MSLRQGTCNQDGCNRTGMVIAKVIPSSGAWCFVCNNKRLATEKLNNGKAPNVYAYKREPTGEGELFLNKWNTEEHVSFIDGSYLGEDCEPTFFLHVLPKAKNKYPLFKLYPKNIVLGTWDQHFQWDQRPRSEIINDPLWKPMFDLEAELKAEYYLIHPNGKV